MGGEPEIFLLVDREGAWEAACAVVDPSFRPPAGCRCAACRPASTASRELQGFPAERLLRRADGRPGFLVSLTEAPSGEGEYEPGGETFGISTRVGDHAGLRRIGVNLDVIRPGERSTKFHWHHEEEECFLVLGGTGLLQVGSDTYPIGPGDFFAKSEGPERAHQFINNGEADLRILTDRRAPRRPGGVPARAVGARPATPRVALLGEQRLGDLEVEEDLLDVVVVLERVDQPQQLARRLLVDRRQGLRHHPDLGRRRR